MGLSPGQRVGPFEVVDRLGAGGMGEVYRARDLRLQRSVALKILPEAVARDADRLARFTREAQTLAALNHPNIAAIYGIEDSGPAQAIAMELIDGEDLSQRIARGALPIDEALAIARQLAEALEAAHDAGIVHRDLKPANVMVRPDGMVKVLDFGLAKVAPAATATPAAGAMNSPTFTSPEMTAAGMLLGTAPYLASEIAKGRPADKRADIWAYGVVLFELLIGRRLFAGDSAMETLTAILRADIDWTALPSSTPLFIRHLLERCLEPDPKLRLRDIGEARILLAAPPATAPPRTRNWRRLAGTIAVAAGLLLAVAAGAARLARAAGGPAFVICSVPSTGSLLSAAWLPDDTIVFAVWREHLYKVAATGGTPIRLLEANPATEVDFHFVEPLPDGRLLIAPHHRAEGTTAFEILDGTRRSVFTQDGAVSDIRPTGDGRVLFLRNDANPGLWTAPFASDTLDLSKATLIRDDAEAFSVAADGTLLMRVHATVTSSLGWPDSSGRLTPVPGGPVGLQRDSLALSPDGRRAALVVAARGAVNLIVRDLQTGADTALTFNRPTDVKGTWLLRRPAWFAAGDRLLYATGGVESAARIFEQRLDVIGAPRALAEGVWASLSRDGRMLFVVNDVRGMGRLFRRAIGADGSIGPAETLVPDLDVDEAEPSPDGTAAAVAFRGEHGRSEIALISLGAAGRQRLTTEGGTRPRFSADGRTLYFLVSEPAAGGERAHRLMQVPVTSAARLQIGQPQRVFAPTSGADPLDISQYAVAGDGRLLVAIEDPASRRSRTVLMQNWPALFLNH